MATHAGIPVAIPMEKVLDTDITRERDLTPVRAPFSPSSNGSGIPLPLQPVMEGPPFSTDTPDTSRGPVEKTGYNSIKPVIPTGVWTLVQISGRAIIITPVVTGSPDAASGATTQTTEHRIRFDDLPGYLSFDCSLVGLAPINPICLSRFTFGKVYVWQGSGANSTLSFVSFENPVDISA